MKTEQDDSEQEDPEAAIIVGKLRKQSEGGKVGDEEDQAEKGDVGAEARRSAVEDVFQILKGRAPRDDEADQLEDALKRFADNC